MKTRQYISLVMLMLLHIVTASAQTNTLTIPDVTVAAGKSISLPIDLGNTTDIVAVQFTLTVPEGITIQPSSASLTERSDGHSITMQPVGANKYMTMIFSPSNKAIKGRTGKLMSVNLAASSALTEGSEHQLTLTDVVIGAANGDNLATGFSAGKVTIAKSPDLEVSAVSTTATTVNPGGRLSVSWQVSNIGGLPTQTGWSEQIYLDGTTESKLLATNYYDTPLNAGGVVSRSAEIDIPQILGVDGNAVIRVKLTPDSNAGEPSWLRDNNTASSQSTLKVGKTLLLSPENANVEEAGKPTVRFYLQRSGSTVADETFALTTTADSRVTLPQSVTVSKGQSGIYFYAQVNANGVLDDNNDVVMTLSGNGYAEVAATLSIEDDTYPSLTLTPSSEDVEEGKTLTFTITAQRAPKEDLEIKLSNNFASRFNVPAVVLPAGETSVVVTVEAKQDDVPDIEQLVTFTASAAGYNPDSQYIALVDDDVPTLQLTLTPDAVSEAAGPLAVVAKLRRTDNINKLVTVKFSDDSDGAIYYGHQTVEMAAGVEEVTVNLGPIDNAMVDGERTYKISAAVWIASCSCNAQSGASGGVVTVPLTVYDNDGPALALTSSASVVKEGGETEVKVSRNTEASAALAVNISSDHDSDLEYPKTVTIPAGETSATFTVKSVKNDVNDDSFTAVMTVESDGFAKANTWFMVTDQTLPDAQISEIEVSETWIEAGEQITVTATLSNTGSYELPELTKVGFYHSGNSTALATAYLQAPLAAGESVTVSKTVSLPNAVGTYNVYAVANDGQAVKELLYTNNTSNTVAVKAVSPFIFTVQTDKEVYLPGETIGITGSVRGKDVGNKAIEVYVINDGYRHVINVDTDENGAFSTTYQPYAGQMGRFAVGACYPKEGLTESLASFDTYGIKRTSSSYITCETLIGEVFNGSFEIKNPGVLPITGANVTVASQPENCIVEVACPETIGAGATTDVSFKITPNAVSEGNDWGHIVLNIETNEGATFETTLYYYCYNTTGKLKASVASINTTMTKGVARDYPIIITNMGKGETGEITLSMPSWIKTVTPTVLPSLSHGDSTEIIFRFIPTEDMSLNVTKRGTIGINCENGSSISLPYSIVPVSEATGKLIVDVCDNYTYYTKEAPHLANAQVVVKNPSTGIVVAEGTTDANGIFETTLPEGYYAISVASEHHDSYSNNIIIDPGKDNNLRVDLTIKTITIDWKVVETEVEDEYRIETVVHYETNVPAAVVKITMPSSIDGDNMAVGESVMINMTLTNVGLITAQNTTVSLPQDLTEWDFEALAYNNPFDLAPQQSVIVPVKITRINGEDKRLAKPKRGPAEDMSNTYSNCMAGMAARYEYLCGKKLSSNAAAERLAMKACTYAATVGAVLNCFNNAIGGSGGPGGPGGGGGTYIRGGEYDDPTPQHLFSICDPCDAARAEKLIQTLTGKTWLGMFDKAVSRTIKEYQKNHGSTNLKFVVRSTGEDITEQVRNGLLDKVQDGLGTLVGYAIDVYEVSTACKDIEKNKKSPKKSKSTDSNSRNDVFDEAALALVEQIRAIDEILLMTYGDRIWYNDMDEKKYDFLSYAQQLSDGYIPTEEEMLAVKPESVTLEQMYAYIRHLNGEGENFPTNETLKTQLDRYEAQDAKGIENGFNNMFEYFEKSLDDYAEYFNEKTSGKSVCASISLKISQKMTMTRQAFRGTLTVFNGHESTAMEDVRLHLEVRDESGMLATSDKMQINAESLDGFGGELGLDKSWSLAAGETGVANILFYPTKHAAPTEERVYSFGGTLTYLDPFTGLEVTRTLYPVTLTVKPSPNLDLTYFMQRDVIGDDPLTQEVEPCEEAEFSLLINNIGYGDATNVRMITNQPEIVDNEKGLLVDFELMSSQLNGGDTGWWPLRSSIATDFGTIPAKSTSYAQWWLKSSLLGHFTDYDVQATHVTSFGNPDLTLLNDVTIHELIRSLEITDGNNQMVGFMTNDIVDAEDTPDMLYLSNGEIETVAVAATSDIVKTSDADYRLTVTPSAAGWNYGNLTDPTYGVVKLKKVVRQSDGKEISLRNFWQTDRTLRDGKDPLYENRIHFADNFATGAGESYTLTFEPMPELLLEVASIEGTPAEGTVAYNHVERVNVMFNKHIDPATFSAEDITLNVQGKKQDANLIGISTEDNKTFALDLTELNKQTGNGYYVLTVQTAQITDTEGYNGKSGKSVGWNMYKDGLILLNTTVDPAEAGTIIGNRNAQYGETVSLTAEANDGYTFSHWTVNNEDGEKDPVWNHVAISDMDITANFIKKSYSIDIDAELDGGCITGYSSGIYPFGEEVNLTVKPDDDYEFCYWIINGERADTDALLTVVVSEATTISARFKYIGQYQLRQDIAEGWNWISSYLNEPQPIDALLGNSHRIVGQFDETIQDPDMGFVGGIVSIEPGKAYKVEANNSYTMTLTGYLHNLDETPISLKRGWNWIAYPYYESRDINAVVTNAEEGDHIASQYGFTSYADGYWEGSISQFHAGQGYLYKSATDKSLAFDFDDLAPKAMAKAKDGAEANAASGVDVHKYPNTMNITARLYHDGSEITDDGYDIYAMSGTELRGIGQFVNGNYYITVYGDKPTEISFVVENSYTDETYLANETMLFTSDIVGSRKSPFAITIGDVNGISSVLTDAQEITIYSVEGILIKRNAKMEDIKKLRRGVYIINNKKYLVK